MAMDDQLMNIQFGKKLEKELKRFSAFSERYGDSATQLGPFFRGYAAVISERRSLAELAHREVRPGPALMNSAE